MIKKLLFFLCGIGLLYSCNLDFPTEADLRSQLDDALYAVPLINDEIKLQDIFESANSDEVTVTSDEEGRVIVSYEGEVLNDPASVVFPPIFGLFDIPLTDTIFQLDLNIGETSNEIDSGVFKRDELYFKYESSSPEPITIYVYIDEITKDGEPIGQTIVHPGSPDGTPVTIAGEPLQLAGWNIAGNDNKVTFHYDARLPSGERVKLDNIYFNFNILEFSYLQGFFPMSSREVVGSFIPINLYNRWISGTMDFVRPRVAMSIENSFGFAVGADFKDLNIETIDNQKLQLESEIITNGIIFNYPGFDEMGEVKYTEFEFNKDNSNIAIIFNNKVKQFNYKIDAVANPLADPDFLGYMREDSYYAVQVKVEVPMELAINNLQLVDTFDVNFSTEKDYLDTAEIKVILENNFPIDVSMQMYMLDSNNEVIDSLFNEGEIELRGATYQGSGILADVDKQEFYIDFPDEKLDNLMKTKRILAKPTFTTTPDGAEQIWIYDTYGLNIKMGAKFSLE